MISNKLGFSLLELLITLSIIAILAVLTLPSYREFLVKSQDQVMSAQLLRAINLTRSEAIARNAVVSLCKNQDGYIIFSADKIIYKFRDISRDGILNWRAFPLDRDKLQFLPSGWPNAENGTFWYCHHAAKNPAWAIVLSQSGRARIVYPDKAGEIDDDKGRALGCV